MKVELQVVEVELMEVVEGLSVHMGRGGRIESNQQEMIPNFIFC